MLTNQCEDDHNKTLGNGLVSQTIEESSLVEVIVESDCCRGWKRKGVGWRTVRN